ncbi:MAG: hypothetical protein E6931_10565 [Clostridium botulinum]|uniref:hypothetical protein n=1 Tax=Clostridium botulinum TaxID=1491 RepID=UPI00131E3F67|nr:hypothetical protein [Clostridium botulinum]MDU1321938.1 hypothetical protein [Clostridium botulinum]
MIKYEIVDINVLGMLRWHIKNKVCFKACIFFYYLKEEIDSYIIDIDEIKIG